DEFVERILQAMDRLEAEEFARLADIGEAVADVAGTRLAEDLRFERWHTHRLSEKAGHVLDRIGVAAADIDDVVGSARLLQRQAERSSDVADVDEVAALLAILEDH